LIPPVFDQPNAINPDKMIAGKDRKSKDRNSKNRKRKSAKRKLEIITAPD